jgi:hypothetical protein
MRTKGGLEDVNAWILAPIVVIDVHFNFNMAAILE